MSASMLARLQVRHARVLIVLGLLVPCLLISIPAFVAYRAQRQLAVSFHWVSHTIEVQSQLQRLRCLLLEAESNQRGFLLGARACLDAFHSSLKQVPPQIEVIRALTADNPLQQQNLLQLDSLVATKVGFMTETISLQLQSQREATLELIRTDRGKQTMDAIDARLELMEKEESRLLTARQEELGSRAQLSTYLLTALVALNLLFAAALLVAFQRLAKMRNLVTMCAWSRTVEYQGEWLSFEKYLLRRFNLNTSHGLSPAEAEKAMAEIKGEEF